MKKLCSIALIFVLTATLLAGCRGAADTNPTNSAPDASSSTQPTLMPKPEVPAPSGTDSTAPNGGDGTDGGVIDPTMPNRMVRPTRGPRY